MTLLKNGISLPDAFVEAMKDLLGDSLDAYLESFESPRAHGLRVNTDKISPEAFLELAPFDLVPIPWAEDGFYVNPEVRPAKHPLFHAGLYYLQEPSAMAPAAVLNPQRGDYVLDVCSAPGGKTLQLANRVGDKGLVVANDISATRLKAVLRNVEQFGLKNVIITCEDIEKFAQKQAEFYDAALLDAPCSGEGMFRKDPSMCDSWTPKTPLEYQQIQSRLIHYLDTILKPSGRLVYSTCTFAVAENEAVIAQGLVQHPHWQVEAIEGRGQKGRDFEAFSRGYALDGDSRLEETRRLYPFKLRGEGHYVALLTKGHLEGSQVAKDLDSKKDSRAKGAQDNRPPKALEAFMEEVLRPPLAEDFRLVGTYRIHGDKVMLEPSGVPDLSGLRVIRRGWYLGDLKKDRFEPAPSFAMGLMFHQIKRVISLALEDPKLIKYLKCETLDVDLENGWYVVCLDQYPLGWAKVVNGQLKNKYPAAWRMQ